MEEWKKYKIGDICRIKHGFAFKGIHFVDEPQKYVCVTPGNFALKGGFKNDKPKYYNGPIPEEYVLQKDDLVVTMTDLSKNGDTLGFSALIPYDEHYIFLHNQRIGLIEDISTDIDKHFLYWVMRTYDYQRYIVGHCSGSTVKHTSPSGIGSYIFRCPEMKMQKEIASVLDNLDDKIEVNRRINDNLEKQAQTIFDSMFPSITSGEDEIGSIITPKRGKGLLSKDAVDGDVPVIAGGLEPATFHNEANTKAPVVTISASGANAGFVNLWQIPVWSSDSSFIDSTMTENVYFWYVMLKKRQKEIFDAQTGSAQPHIYPKHIAEMPLGKFEQTDVEKFTEIVTPMFEIRGRNLKESERLASIRDTLLPKLMSGELNLENVNV